MAKRQGTEYLPRPDLAGNRPEEKKQPEPEVLVPALDPESTDPERVKLERERRRFVKRTGGLRKNLNPSDAERAAQLSKGLGCSIEDGWLAMHIPEFDNAIHKDNVRKPDPVEAMTKAVDNLVHAGAADAEKE